MRDGGGCEWCTTSVPACLSRILKLLNGIPIYLLLLLLCNAEPTLALSIVYPPTLRVALIHGTYRDSRISRPRLLVNARRGWGQHLMIAGPKRRHRGRGHATRAAASNYKATHYPRRLWCGSGGRRGKTVICFLRIMRVRVWFSGHPAILLGFKTRWEQAGRPGGEVDRRALIVRLGEGFWTEKDGGGARHGKSRNRKRDRGLRGHSSRSYSRTKYVSQTDSWCHAVIWWRRQLLVLRWRSVASKR